MSVNTPVPLVEDARSSSHGIAVASGESTCATFAPLTTLASTVDVQFGPTPCVPTWTLAESYSFASGALSTHA